MRPPGAAQQSAPTGMRTLWLSLLSSLTMGGVNFGVTFGITFGVTLGVALGSLLGPLLVAYRVAESLWLSLLLGPHEEMALWL